MNIACAAGSSLRRDRAAVALAGGAVAAAVVDFVLATVWFLTRPSCLPGSARLLDLAVPYFFGGGVVAFLPALATLAGALAIRRGLPVWPVRVGAVCCIVFALLFAAQIGHEITVNLPQRYDTGCWSF